MATITKIVSPFLAIAVLLAAHLFRLPSSPVCLRHHETFVPDLVRVTLAIDLSEQLTSCFFVLSAAAARSPYLRPFSLHLLRQELFEILDVDDGGQLTQDEFIDGLVNMFLQDRL